jgi:hypothetical protein
MAKSGPVSLPSGDGMALECLFRLLPRAQRQEWSYDLAQLQRWKVNGFIGQSMNYPALFWPALVECGDCMFLAARSPGDLLPMWLRREGTNRQALESELNSIYMGDLFTGYPAEPTREQVIWLARLLRKMWGWKIQQEFPHRRILVAFDEGAADVLRSYITFFQAPTT